MKKLQAHKSALSVLQQSFEDLTQEHDQTLRRLAALREENISNGNGADVLVMAEIINASFGNLEHPE